jgi:molybdenum cofactor cytidylyltransferase
MEDRTDATMTPDPLGAIVLAAGRSSRMGRPKALLPLDGEQTFVERIHRTLRDARLDPIVVVTRPELGVQLQTLIPAHSVEVNPQPERGQLSSLLVGVHALQRPAAVLVTLVDLPLVTLGTVNALVEAWRRTGAPLIRPVHSGRHGHPIIVCGPVIAALAAADLTAGAKPVIHAFAAQGLDVIVDDPGTVDDVDTPEQYARVWP